ncbi:MAG TPA: Bax inhibitor-1/YccA family protein, partial [Candidatus Deferrimicrobiaceae bacterium]
MQERYEVDQAGALVRTRTGVMNGVYGWMALGLAVTALVSQVTISIPGVLQIVFGNMFVFYGLLIAEVGLVMYLSARIMTMATGTAKAGFMAYAALNGVTLSVIFLAYTADSIASVFLITAGMFGATSAYGYVTKRDLTGFGSFLFMGLIGIVIASVVNIFLKSSMMSFVISCVGVLVFLGLTAYDTQKLKVMGETAPAGDATAVRRGTILGALTLYLDFIN